MASACIHLDFELHQTLWRVEIPDPAPFRVRQVPLGQMRDHVKRARRVHPRDQIIQLRAGIECSAPHLDIGAPILIDSVEFLRRLLPNLIGG
ncbi:hypothetical protein ACFFX0_29400 [Citricoccus parietis]|uniref:Uncharacterized protein n=1 Tax=Citricoccus parietis TaxID=592307 RepID=A0ABV5G815_9MICC